MKIILTLLMLIASITAFSQTSTSDTTSVGDQLIRFERQHGNGNILAFAGTVTVVVGASVVATPIMVAGTIMLVIGEIISLDSYRHIRMAGLLMNQNRIGTNIKLIEN